MLSFLNLLQDKSFHMLAITIGLFNGLYPENKVKDMEDGTGFDALNEKYVDMVDAGIIDPTKVTRTALQNATSVASTFLTTEAVVAELPSKDPMPAAGMNGGMGGMM